eukprot:6562174-Pyramimonas_sp.AAC.1
MAGRACERGTRWRAWLGALARNGSEYVSTSFSEYNELAKRVEYRGCAPYIPRGLRRVLPDGLLGKKQPTRFARGL